MRGIYFGGLRDDSRGGRAAPPRDRALALLGSPGSGRSIQRTNGECQAQNKDNEGGAPQTESRADRATIPHLGPRWSRVSPSDYAAIDWTGGLWAGAGPFDWLRARHGLTWARIFPVCRARHRQVDHGGLLAERDDAHGASTSGAPQRSDFLHLLDEARPRAFRGRWNNKSCSPPPKRW